MLHLRDKLSTMKYRLALPILLFSIFFVACISKTEEVKPDV